MLHIYMRFSLFDSYGAKNSAPVFAAFRAGLERLGVTASDNDLDADVAVIWSVVWAGRMRDNQAVWKHYRNHGRPVVVLEVGMLDRSRTWKIGINGTGLQSRFAQEFDLDRPSKLKIQTRQWRCNGNDILICCQREDSEQWIGQPPLRHWLDDVVSQIRKVSDRRILVRSHPRRPGLHPPGTVLQRPIKIAGTYDGYDFDQVLQQAWCVINWNSGPGSQAALQGVPVFVGPDSLASPVGSQDLCQIESPLYPDRSAWLIDICHTEWTLPEISQGIMIDQLLTRIKSL